MNTSFSSKYPVSINYPERLPSLKIKVPLLPFQSRAEGEVFITHKQSHWIELCGKGSHVCQSVDLDHQPRDHLDVYYNVDSQASHQTTCIRTPGSRLRTQHLLRASEGKLRNTDYSEWLVYFIRIRRFLADCSALFASGSSVVSRNSPGRVPLACITVLVGLFRIFPIRSALI